MSEAVQQSSIPDPPGEQKMEGEMRDEMATEKNTTKTSGLEPKKDDDAMAKAGGASEAKSDLPSEKESKDAAPSTNQEMTSATESDAGRILTADPCIKVEPGVLSESVGDSQEKEPKGDTVKLEKDALQKSAIPVFSKGSTNENVAVPTERVPKDGQVEASVRTNTHSTDTELSKEQEELKGKDRSSSHVEISGSTTESMDTASTNHPSCSVELPPAGSANSETKTDMVLLKIKEETTSMPETTGVKETSEESILTTDTQRVSFVEASAVKENDKMEIDSEVKPVTDNFKDIPQNKEMLPQAAVQKTNFPSDRSELNKETHDTGAVQKQETSIKRFMQQEMVTVDIVPKKEVLPQMVVEKSKAVHEIIAEQSSRLDRDRLVPTSVPLDRQSLNQTSASPVPSAGEKLVPTPVPLVGENFVPTSVPSLEETLVPVPVSSERESLVPTPVPQEKSEPATLTESTEPAASDTKAEESLDDWDIPATDDEEDGEENQADGVEKKKRKVVKRGYWEPPIDVIVDLYNKLDKDGILELTWKCPGRRPPSEEGDKEEEKEQIEDVQDEEAMEISQEEDPTEFDFDMDMESVQKMTPRRNIGSGQAQGSGKKRVARMDKVLNDIFRHRKIDSTMVDNGKKDGESKEDDQAMDTSTSPIIPTTRPADKFHIRSDLNM